MCQPFPAEAVAFLHDLRIIRAGFGIDRCSGLEALSLENLHEPPDAHTNTVVPPRVVQYIRFEARGHRSQRDRGLVVVKMLDVWHDPDRDACAVWQLQWAAARNGRVVESAMLHLPSCRHPGSISPDDLRV